jgi:hypothetical protein
MRGCVTAHGAAGLSVLFLIVAPLLSVTAPERAAFRERDPHVPRVANTVVAKGRHRSRSEVLEGVVDDILEPRIAGLRRWRRFNTATLAVPRFLVHDPSPPPSPTLCVYHGACWSQNPAMLPIVPMVIRNRVSQELKQRTVVTVFDDCYTVERHSLRSCVGLGTAGDAMSVYDVCPGCHGRHHAGSVQAVPAERCREKVRAVVLCVCVWVGGWVCVCGGGGLSCVASAVHALPSDLR